MKLKSNILVACVFVLVNALADISVSDVKVFSGYPWKEVVVGYTITGTPAETDFDIIELSATDKSANKTYTTRSLTGAVLTEGRHVLRWNAATEGVKFSSENVVFSVSIVRQGVQLWANGPYWAECNVGASKPSEWGYYFWWGDTVGYWFRANSWVSAVNGESFSFGDPYSFAPGNFPTCLKRLSQLQSEGFIDSTGNLVAKYDAATKYFGPQWRMPTAAEWDALISNCTTTWTTLDGIAGCLVTGKGSYTAKSIFLPAAGFGCASRRNDSGSVGHYWSSTPESDELFDTLSLSFRHNGFGRGSNSRDFGLSVRPVRGFAK